MTEELRTTLARRGVAAQSRKGARSRRVHLTSELFNARVKGVESGVWRELVKGKCFTRWSDLARYSIDPFYPRDR
jgi:hypothetical protein